MIHTLTGSNVHAIDERVAQIVSDYRSSGGDSIERIDADTIESIDAVIAAVSSISLFDPTKLVIIRSLSAHKQLAEEIETVVDRTHENTTLVIVELQIDKRSKLYKFLQKNTQFESFQELQGADLSRWIKQYVSDRSGSIDNQAMNELVSRVGEDQKQIQQELDKLLLNSPDINRQVVESLVDALPQSKVFDLLDAVFRKDLEAVNRLYEDQRAQGEDPLRIIGMITWQLTQIYKALYASDKTELTKSGVSPYSAQKSIQIARAMGGVQMKKSIDDLVYVDIAIKNGADPDTALLAYLTDLTIS